MQAPTASILLLAWSSTAIAFLQLPRIGRETVGPDVGHDCSGGATGLRGLTRVATSSRRTFRLAKGRKVERRRRGERQQPQSQRKGRSTSAGGQSLSSSPSSSATVKENSKLSAATETKSAPEEPIAENQATKGFGRISVDEAYEQAIAKLKGRDSSNTGPLIQGPRDASSSSSETSPVTRNIDLLDFIPKGIQTVLEYFLIAALSLTLLLIIGLGVGFTLEALPTSNVELPENLREISKQAGAWVGQYDKLFTPGLITFFVLSSLLGSFKLAQLGKGGGTYSEVKDPGKWYSEPDMGEKVEQGRKGGNRQQVDE